MTLTKQNRPYLAIDLDDVTAKCNQKALEIYNEENGTNYVLSDLTSWDFNDGMLTQIYTRPELYSNLEVVENAQDVIAYLQGYFKVIFVTASPNKESTFAKYAWVEKHFPSIGHAGMISTTHKHLIQAFALIDDSPKNITHYPNGYRIIMDKPYNQNLVEGIDYDFRVTNWLEIKSLFKKLITAELVSPAPYLQPSIPTIHFCEKPMRIGDHL